MKIPVSISLDSDGFVRRGCPTCDREFKWLHTDDESVAEEPDDLGYFCPYCGVQSQPDTWFTEAQVENMEDIGTAAASKEVDKILSGSTMLKYTPGDRPEPSEPPPEPDDMVRVDFSCHPDEPLKVAESWDRAIHCLICGIVND